MAGGHRPVIWRPLHIMVPRMRSIGRCWAIRCGEKEAGEGSIQLGVSRHGVSTKS